MKRKREQRSREGEDDGGDNSSCPRDVIDSPSRKRRRLPSPAQRSESVKQPEVTFSDLPYVALVQIFGYLDDQDKGSVARVSQQCRDVVYSPSLWKTTDARLDLNRMTPQDLESLKHRGIRSVTLVKASTPDKVRQLLSIVTTLESLHAENYVMSKRQAESALAQDLPAMKHLQVHLSNGEVFADIAKHMKNLVSLELWTSFHADMLCSINTLTNIKRLHLTSERTLSLNGITLRDVDLPELEELTIDCRSIGDAFLGEVAQVLPKLQKLSLCSCNEATEAGILALAQMTQLQELQLRGEASHFSASVASLVTGLTRLTMLDLSCILVKDTDMRSLAAMPQLKVLALRTSIVEEEGWKILSQGCRQLVNLQLLHPSDITRASAEYLARLPKLQHLFLAWASFTHISLHRLCRALSHVSILGLLCVERLSDASLKVVAKMPFLETLCIASNSKITDKGLRYLSESRSLWSLCLTDVPNITDSGLATLAEGLPSLETLDISLCSKVRVRGLQEIVERSQGLRELSASLSTQAKRRLKSIRPGVEVNRQ